MTEEKISLIEYMARDGIPLKKIKKELGITRAEWNRYIKENPDAEKRLEMLKTITDYEVENAILRRATGYSYEEVREVDKGGVSECVTTKKEVSPDVGAATFWLKCRKGDIWNDKRSEPDDSRMDEILKRLDEEAGNAK